MEHFVTCQDEDLLSTVQIHPRTPKENSYNTAIPISLYIHMPWCIKKCPYCDFNSYAIINKIPEQEYIAALLTDCNNELSRLQGRKLCSIFFGGGTPSLFSASSINTLLEHIHAMMPFSEQIEITLEANPSTIEQKYLGDYRQAGITRISLGAQSFQDEKLQALGRIHTAQEIFTSLAKIQQANFNSFNIDLMYNLPRQSIADAIFDLQTAISFNPQHISWYELTIEPNTMFYHNNIVGPNEEIGKQIQQQGQSCLQQAGFKQYEISAFAKQQYECLHNTNYWQFGDYMGIGAGAHSKITDFNKQIIYRTVKKQSPQAYLYSNGDFVEDEQILANKQIVLEFMLNALRFTEGFPKELFKKHTNLPLSNIDAILEQAHNKGLLNISKEKIMPTNLGKMFLNDLLQLFVQ